MEKKDLLVLTVKNCPACEKFETVVEDIEICKIDEGGKCGKIAKDILLFETPTVVAEDDNGNFYKCSLEYKDGKYTAICKEKKIDL